MKKATVFLSFLFLFLISVSSDSFASGVCKGTAHACTADTRQTVLSCTGFTDSAVPSAAAGCSWTASTATASGSCAGTEATCNIESGRLCNAVPGCSWVVTANANDNAFVETMCNALKIVTGNGGKAFAAFAIISVGIGFFTGKVSWGLMIGVTAGIAAMFGAPTIVAAIAGGNALDCGSGRL